MLLIEYLARLPTDKPQTGFCVLFIHKRDFSQMTTPSFWFGVKYVRKGVKYLQNNVRQAVLIQNECGGKELKNAKWSQIH